MLDFSGGSVSSVVVDFLFAVGGTSEVLGPSELALVFGVTSGLVTAFTSTDGAGAGGSGDKQHSISNEEWAHNSVTATKSR